MIVRSSFFALAVAAILSLWMTGSQSQNATEVTRVAPHLTVSDSALDELAAGRFWHAARMMRAEGAGDGTPDDILTLAHAEAGWENWPAVLDLLEDVDWTESVGEGQGLYLLGRGLEYAERWADAADAYVRYRGVSSPTTADGVVSLARAARSAWRAGDPEATDRALAALRPVPHVRSWTASELALVAAEAGDVEGVRRLAIHAVEPAAAGTLWRAGADAHLAAGDSATARDRFARLRSTVAEGLVPEATVTLGRLTVASGDTAAGRVLLLEGFETARGGARTRAAAALVGLGNHGFEEWLELASVLGRAGDGARALRAYDAAHGLAPRGTSTSALPEMARLERARLMSTVRNRQGEALEEFRAIRETTESERIGSRNLELWMQMRSRQGMTSQVNTLRRWILEEYPSSSAAAEVAWGQAYNAEARGALDAALERYAFLIENVRTHSRAGQARMRSGQLHLRRGDLREAAEVFEQYLTDFPDGRRWQEAAYWAGRTRLELGDTIAAEAHLRHVLSQPVEYYAVMAADLLGVDFEVDMPAGEGPEEPGWLTEGLARLDMLTGAGLERGAEAEIERLLARAGDTRGPRLRLAQALIDRGRTIDGINLGWALLRDEGWDREILHVTYPFPYRELVRREAEEWGIDPFMMAAIIRQESAFKADIVSHAGAIGLMQVMPPTGAQLARAHGPDGFTETSLTKPEVNLHLGAAFFVDMSRRYDNELPLVLSAYNAGPTRATRWRRYPEASDPLRFTERIPFTETRGYVKNVRRNLGLYRVLYGQD
ncbi:MAG: transglycosylase SLT domain-containing protein [Gemmatimonadetes bacterium]|nr:transglycosylase SLT domain-containing protein [Gemmatimonadota bacterium]